ncbi:hypothetical protein SDC9_173393 [bioreactor metagenome]|uniref:Uncharacterized protein n=1 Tax=bioreactor metagenome TaxID=1076179 RepID=A0A645GG91_9ZZZZ
MPNASQVLYSGMAITSKGIMNENRNTRKIAFLPQKSNFANVKPARPLTKKPNATVTAATRREFITGTPKPASVNRRAYWFSVKVLGKKVNTERTCV